MAGIKALLVYTYILKSAVQGKHVNTKTCTRLDTLRYLMLLWCRTACRSYGIALENTSNYFNKT